MSPADHLRFDANLKWLFTELPFVERFDAAAAAGFAAVEYASPYEHSARELRRRLDDAGLQQILINTPGGEAGSPTRSGLACFPDLIEQFRREFDQALDHAVALDSQMIHVTAGICPEGVDRSHAFAVFVTNIGWAAERATGSAVRLVLEAQNHRDVPGFILDSQEQAVGVIQAVDSENVGLLFDVYHCQVQQGDVATRLKALLPHVAHIQISDPPNRTEPGTGELGWDVLFEQIEAFGYGGWIGCEYRPTNGTVEGLGWLDRYQASSRHDQR